MFKILFQAIFIYFIAISSLYSINRDYNSFILNDEGELDYDEQQVLDENNDYSDFYGCFYCVEHFDSYYYSSRAYIRSLLPYQGNELLKLIPPYEYSWLGSWYDGDVICKHTVLKNDRVIKNSKCENPCVYQGYLDLDFRKYNSFIEEQIKYFSKHPECNCFWPERSENAAKINNLAYVLFEDLFTETKLSKLINNYEEQYLYLNNISWELNVHGLCVSSVCRSFWFSHYYRVALHLLDYAENKYQKNEITEVELNHINEKLNKILYILAQTFEYLYENCLEQHFSTKIKQEFDFLKSITPFLLHYETIEKTQFKILCNKFDVKEKNVFCNRTLGKFNPVFQEIEPMDVFLTSNGFFAEYYLYQGVYNNDVMQFSKAIDLFNKSIKFDNRNKLTYLARAYAHFELRNYEEAQKDYCMAKSLEITPPLLPGVSCGYHALHAGSQLNRIEFSKGFSYGIMEGFNEGSRTFIPSILHTITGIAQGIWVFAQDPVNISLDVVNSVGFFITLAESALVDEEIRDETLTELKDLLEKWFSLTDFEKGRQIGFIIGKYGIDVLLINKGMKLIRSFRELKYLHGELTLQVLEKQKSSKTILEKAEKQAKARKLLFKEGKIKISWADQNKHFPDSNNYIEGRSFFTIFKSKLEKLVEKYAGSGRSIPGRQIGELGYKEIVDFEEIIGIYIKEDSKGNIILKNPTQYGTIHYKKDCSLHVVPANPNQY